MVLWSYSLLSTQKLIVLLGQNPFLCMSIHFHHSQHHVKMVFEAENGSLTCYAASHFYVPLSGALQFVLCWVWLEQKATKAMRSKILKGIVYFFSKIHTTTARSTFYLLPLTKRTKCLRITQTVVPTRRKHQQQWNTAGYRVIQTLCCQIPRK